MDLYRFIVTAGGREIPVVVSAEDDESAFRVVEQEIARSFLKPLQIDDVALLEKKKIRGTGSGFVIQPRKAYE
ncbi:DUF3906 family protein [Terrilactibacillus sp. S3-3]|nr:DUF3906 family protein [Terrilactibacillus sp. S3-3]